MIERIAPMLAVAGEPFDSEDHFYEVKWDGVRCLAAVESQKVRLWGRELADYTQRYPELHALDKLPGGTVVDGELVVLREGRADLPALLRRHQLGGRLKRRWASQRTPVVYVLFDLLYHAGTPVMGQPLGQRRRRLAELLDRFAPLRTVLSDGVVGRGTVFFEQVVGQGHEGVMAKHLASRYLPGRRSAGWRKIKPAETIPCMIIGYIPSQHGIRSLLVATRRDGTMQYVGEVRCGLPRDEWTRLAKQLPERVCPRPIVPCRKRAVWVAPQWYCKVRSLGWTEGGRLRGAHLIGLFEPS